MLGNLTEILKKAEEHADAKKIDHCVFINARLAPDMFPLSRQVQITTDSVKGCAARLAGIEIPSYADTETTFADLYARINKTVEFIKSVAEHQIDGTEEKQIKLSVGKRNLEFTGQVYLLNFVIPNFYFHLVTTYAILRHNGVDVGKMDFLGKE
jgi:hypothetical protein